MAENSKWLTNFGQPCSRHSCSASSTRHFTTLITFRTSNCCVDRVRYILTRVSERIATLYEPVLMYKLVVFAVAILMRMIDFLNIFLTCLVLLKTTNSCILRICISHKSSEALTAFQHRLWENMHVWDPGYRLRMSSFADSASLKLFKNLIQAVVDTWSSYICITRIRMKVVKWIVVRGQVDRVKVSMQNCWPCINP